MIKADFADLILTVLPDSRVDMVLFLRTPAGRLRRVGQRFTIAPWQEILAAINPASNVRVVVRVAGNGR
jgi:hypothetical protein